LDRVDRRFLADRPGDQDERHVHAERLHVGERIEPRPRGKLVVGQDDIEGAGLDQRLETFPRAGDFRRERKTAPPERRQAQFHVRVVVLNNEDTEWYLARWRGAGGAGRTLLHQPVTWREGQHRGIGQSPTPPDRPRPRSWLPRPGWRTAPGRPRRGCPGGSSAGHGGSRSSWRRGPAWPRFPSSSTPRR